ncbi:MAG: STAS domain-containing protein [Clostridia bacterium]|nr:STAS domain-containing protein [Clostridia bacterium]
MRVESKFLNRILYIRPSGEIDEHNATSARKEVDTLAEQYVTLAQQVVFDLGEISFMDSTGIGFLIGRYKKFHRYGVPMYIANPSQATDKILTVSGVYTLIPKI